MTLADAQRHHRRAEDLQRQGYMADSVMPEAALAANGYLEELVRLLTPAPVASMPDAGDLRSVRAF